MGVSLEEQEIVINASRTKEMASIYVSDRRWITKMEKKVAANPELFTVKEVFTVDGEMVGKVYEFPARLISIRSKITKRVLTEEQKAAQAERLAAGRKKRLEQTDENDSEDDFGNDSFDDELEEDFDDEDI